MLHLSIIYGNCNRLGQNQIVSYFLEKM